MALKNIWSRATIISRNQLSPTVTGLTLHVHSPYSAEKLGIRCDGTDEDAPSSFTFLPGQWIDFSPVPSSSWRPHPKGTIGGYSITSIPQDLPRIDLAIQASRHPVASWVTDSAQPNDLVNIRVGGTFTYPRHCTIKRDDLIKTGSGEIYCANSNADFSVGEERIIPPLKRLLFIAGGVGINPLFSMIQQWHVDISNMAGCNSRAVLLYSVRKTEDLLFLENLDKMANEATEQLLVILTTTNHSQETTSISENLPSLVNVTIRQGKIDFDMIQEAVNWLNRLNDSQSTQEDKIADAALICGPPGMPESMLAILCSAKDKNAVVRSRENVHFEQWW